MLLRNLLPTKKNTAVSVNGHIYFIGPELGIVDKETGKPVDVPQEDAAKLLKNERAWRQWDGKAPDTTKPTKPARAKGGIQLVDGSGNVIPKEDATKPVMDAVTKAKDADNTVAMQEAQEKFEASKQADEESEDEDEGEVEDEGGDPPIPEEGGEWADPEPHYSMEWLMACADAYEVSYRKNISAAKLCEKIKDAMYE